MLTITSKRATRTSRQVYDYLKLVDEAIGLSFDLEKNRANISAYMKVLQNEGLLEMKSEGSGQIPAVYKMKKNRPAFWVGLKTF